MTYEACRRFEYRYRRLREMLTAHPEPVAILPKPTKTSGLVPPELLRRFGGETSTEDLENLDLGLDEIHDLEPIEQQLEQDLRDLALDDD